MVPDLWEQRQGVSTETIYLPVSLRAWSFFGLQLCWLAAQSGVRQALTVSHCSQQTAWPRSLTLSSLLTMHMYHALFLSMLRLFFLFFLEPQLHADLLLHFFFFFFFFLSFFAVTFFFFLFFVVVHRSSSSVLSFLCVCFWSNSNNCTVPHKRI